MNRPIGITIAAVLSLMDGFLNLVGGYGAFSLGGWQLGGYVLPFFSPPPGGEGAAATQLVLGFGAVLLGLGQLVFAWGAWNLVDWTWVLGVALAGLGVLLAVWGLFSGAVTPATPMMSLLLPAAIGVYLLIPRTRRAFGLLTASET
jgi:hypothetical protein